MRTGDSGSDRHRAGWGRSGSGSHRKACGGHCQGTEGLTPVGPGLTGGIGGAEVGLTTWKEADTVAAGAAPVRAGPGALPHSRPDTGFSTELATESAPTPPSTQGHPRHPPSPMKSS